MVDVGGSLVVLSCLGIAGAAKGGVVEANGRLIPGQPTTKLVPLAMSVLHTDLCLTHCRAGCRGTWQANNLAVKPHLVV